MYWSDQKCNFKKKFGAVFETGEWCRRLCNEMNRCNEIDIANEVRQKCNTMAMTRGEEQLRKFLKGSRWRGRRRKSLAKIRSYQLEEKSWQYIVYVIARAFNLKFKKKNREINKHSKIHTTEFKRPHCWTFFKAVLSVLFNIWIFFISR